PRLGWSDASGRARRVAQIIWRRHTRTLLDSPRRLYRLSKPASQRERVGWLLEPGLYTEQGVTDRVLSVTSLRYPSPDTVAPLVAQQGDFDARRSARPGSQTARPRRLDSRAAN